MCAFFDLKQRLRSVKKTSQHEVIEPTLSQHRKNSGQKEPFFYPRTSPNKALQATGDNAVFLGPTDMKHETTYEDPSSTTPKEREKHFGQYDHLRMYGGDYDKRLAKGGFNVRVYDLFEELGDGYANKYGLMKDEFIYFCQK